MKVSALTLFAIFALACRPTLAPAAELSPSTTATPDLAPFRTTQPVDGAEHELAYRSNRAANNNNNYDPLVDLATPGGSPPPEYGPPAYGHSYGAAPAESPWLHLGLYGNGFYYAFGGPNYFCPPPADPPGPGTKSGMLQRLIVTETWLSGGDAPSEMGVNDIEIKPILALPLPWLATPLVLTPGFGAHYFNGPSVVDVPADTYDAYLDIRWMRQISPCVGIDVAVTPGWYSDYEQSSSDALRIGGRGVGLITCSPTFQVALGFVYLDRDDVSMLPLGGVIWTPNPDTKYELLLPRPKISRRLCHDCNNSYWAYAAGEFGGGAWAVERATGAEDMLYYRDYRAIVGVERNSIYGFGGRVEAGYVFSRQLQYRSNDVDVDLDSAWMLRAELSY